MKTFCWPVGACYERETVLALYYLLRQNHSNSAIRHLRKEKETGAEMRPAIVSGILLGDTRFASVSKRGCKAIDMKMTFCTLCKENSFFS